MQILKTTLITLAAVGTLGSSHAVLADNSKDRPFEGIVAEEIVSVKQLADEVQSGSIALVEDNDDSEQIMAKLASITSSEATEIALRALPGKVVETELDNENGYLIWAVEVINGKGNETKLMIDAGNGRLLAAENEDDEDEGFN